MRLSLIGLLTSFISLGHGQNLKLSLDNALNKLQADEQFRHSTISMYVVETRSGNIVFEKNGQAGMVPASCQKVVTSVAAFDILGKDFVYKTVLAYDGEIKNKTLNGSLYLLGSGDPTLGSWRWKQTKEETILDKITSAIIEKDIHKINVGFFGYTPKWGSNTIPDGWVWEDIGNYYGAGAAGLNWRENQYDLLLKSGSTPGSAVSITSIKPMMTNVELISELRTGEKGSGDNAYIYLPPYSNKGYIRGTIPPAQSNFLVSGSFPDPTQQLMNTLAIALKSKNIDYLKTAPYQNNEKQTATFSNLTPLLTIESPTLDSINYWFLKKSINLYGEAFIKTIAYKQSKLGSTDTGVAIIKDFWSKRGIEKSALHIFDGSGLSPANRVTANALVTVMQYARKQPWFSSFYEALPEMNGIKMKDGYIGGVRSYTGYIKSKAGTDYTFSFLVNNFDGSATAVREKNVEGAGSFKVTSAKINIMKEQNFKSHAHYVPLYHFVTGFLIIAGLVGACINFVNAYQQMGARLMAGLLVIAFVIAALFYWFIRAFALRAHDKAIRAEENLRYFSLTGKLMDETLTMGQIIALRFAPKEELVELANRAAKESLSPTHIKQSIKNWKADHHRV